MNIIKTLKFLGYAPVLLLLISCSVNVVHAPVEMMPVAADQQVIKKLSKDVDVKLDTAYTRSLKTGSQWTRIGRISQGDVYRPYKDVFTIEGGHIHEAYLVVANDKLVGFYLPYERGFSSLQQSIFLTLQ